MLFYKRNLCLFNYLYLYNKHVLSWKCTVTTRLYKRSFIIDYFFEKIYIQE